MNSTWACFYVTVTIPSGDQYFPAGTMGFGLLSYSTQTNWEVGDRWDYECNSWSNRIPQSFFDAPWKTAVSFGIIGVLTTGLGLLAAIIMSCMTFDRIVLQIFSALLFLGSIAEILTFIAFGSDICSTYNCEFSIAAGLAIGASIASFVAAILFYKIPPGRDFIPATPMFAAEPPGTVTVQETVEPDGTKKTVKTTVNADGSKTVEETIERPQVQAY
jgi:hypothetical protein